jgi:hypothetical protein
MGLLDFLKKKELSEIKSLKEQLEYYRPVIDVDLEARQKLLEISELEIKRSELSRGYGAGLDTFTSTFLHSHESKTVSVKSSVSDQ